jgi:hypothetical protein
MSDEEKTTKMIYGTSAKMILIRTKPDSRGKSSIHKFCFNPKYEDSIILKGSEVIETEDGQYFGINGFGIFTHNMIQYFAWNSVIGLEIINEEHIYKHLMEEEHE